MEVVFKGTGDPSKIPNLIKEGGRYFVIEELQVGESKSYHIKIDKNSTGVYPTDWFCNLTEMIEKYSAKVGYLPNPVSVGTGARIVVNALPEGCNNKKLETLYTAPVVDVEEFASNWVLIKTKSQNWYIGSYNNKIFKDFSNM